MKRAGLLMAWMMMMASSAQSAKLYGMFDAYPGQTEFIGGDVTVEDGGSNTITMKADLKSKRFFLFFVCLFIILPSPFFLFFNGFSGTFHVFGCPIAITNHTPAYVNPPLLSQPIPRLAHTSSPSLSLSSLSFQHRHVHTSLPLLALIEICRRHTDAHNGRVEHQTRRTRGEVG